MFEEDARGLQACVEALSVEGGHGVGGVAEDDDACFGLFPFTVVVFFGGGSGGGGVMVG